MAKIKNNKKGTMKKTKAHVIHSKSVKKINSARAALRARPKQKLTKDARSNIHSKKIDVKAVVEKPKLDIDIKRAKEISDEKKSQKAKQASMPTKDEVRKIIAMLMSNDEAMNYLKKNVSRRTSEVITMLEIPRTDEFIAEQLETKVNTVRRILNIMHGYGLTNYYIAKNSNGWLSFEWYINVNKVQQFFDYIREINSNKMIINDECNDYFICEDCYEKYKLIFVFDSAFELGFKCSCGKKLTRLDREAAEKLVNQSRIEAVAAAKASEAMQESIKVNSDKPKSP